MSDQQSKIEPLPEWTEQEKWVWKKIRNGEIADFNEGVKHGGKLDPKNSKDWPDNRILTPSFLKTILLDEPFQSAIPYQGVCIIGACLKEPLDLSNARLSKQMWLDEFRFESNLSLTSLNTSSRVGWAEPTIQISFGGHSPPYKKRITKYSKIQGHFPNFLFSRVGWVEEGHPTFFK